MRNKTRVTIVSIEYNVNKEKGTCVCILKAHLKDFFTPEMSMVYKQKRFHEVSSLGYITVTGISKCCPSDIFDPIKGKRIAESKAKINLYRKAQEIYKTCRDYYYNIHMNFADLVASLWSVKDKEILHLWDLDDDNSPK